jgi:hypothetical protein
LPFVYWLARDERVDFDVVMALNFDVLDFLGLDQNVRLFCAFIAALFVLVFDCSLATSSTSCCRNRLSVFLFFCRNDSRSVDDVLA